MEKITDGLQTTNFNLFRLNISRCAISFRSSFKASHKYRSNGRRGGLMVSALDFGASGPGSSPGRGHCVVFLGKTLYSHGASLHPGV